jgi:hypothetical protein
MERQGAPTFFLQNRMKDVNVIHKIHKMCEIIKLNMRVKVKEERSTRIKLTLKCEISVKLTILILT